MFWIFFLCCGRSCSKARREAVEKCAKSMKPLASQTRQTMEKPTEQKETRQQRRHANLPARFAFRQQRKQRNNTKRGRSHTKKTHKSMGIASDTIRLSPPCLRNMHKSLWPKQTKRGEKLSNCEKQQQGC